MAGTTLVVPAGSLKTLGTLRSGDLRLPGLEPRHAAARYRDLFEIQPLQGQMRVNGDLVSAGHWKPLRPGDTLELGPYSMRVELLGLSAETLVGAQRTRRLVPVGTPPGFEVQGRLGTGGFATVYAARRLSDGQLLALKILHTKPNPRLLSRFRREVEACASFDHPHVVRVIEYGIDREPPYVAMELVKGASAQDLLLAGPLERGRALRIALGVAKALSALAQAQLVHRDVKPANVLVTGDVAKLADFGLVKDLQGRVTTLTKTGTGMGTLAYVAPEQLSDAKHVDTSVDVYGLGASLFALLTGRPPFVLETAADLLQIFRQAPPSLIDLLPDCPPRVAALVHSALDKEPSQRPSAADFVVCLQQVLG
jgi:serine/threonine protein kinase